MSRFQIMETTCLAPIIIIKAWNKNFCKSANKDFEDSQSAYT